MIDIPLGKALIAVKRRFKNCDDCALQGSGCPNIPCNASFRKDGKNVIFKLVDYKEEKL